VTEHREIARIQVSTRSGKVRVLAEEGAQLSVEGGVVVGEELGVVEIRRDRNSKEITIVCPAGTDLTAGTISGSIETLGRLGSVRVASVSGKVHVTRATRVDVRSKSGAIEVDEVAGECRIVVTSAKVHIGRAQRAVIAGVSGIVTMEGVDGAEVKTVSGKVLIATQGASDVNVRTVSGRVEVTVPPDVQPSTRLKSISGKVRCDCPTGHDGAISVTSVSGTIHVACA
jgi:DUF4097 and DUF4098 domain-containing protein YvlB